MGHPRLRQVTLQARDILARRYGPGVGPEAVADRVLERIEALPPESRPLLYWDADLLRSSAAESARRLAEGHARTLEGLPAAIKDNFVVEGMPTTAGARNPAALPERPSPFVGLLREAGAIPFAKAHMTEYALRAHGRNPHYGDLVSPLSEHHNAGGSSSGSAVAVALGLAVFGVGSDTAGSIRMPAAACGLVGYKPAYGAWSLEGVVPLSRSCDHVGLLCARVDELRLVLAALGEDTEHGAGGAGAICHPAREVVGPLHPEVAAAFEKIREAVGSRERTDLIDAGLLDRCVAAYEVIRGFEAWRDLGQPKEGSAGDLGDEVAEAFRGFAKVGETEYREALADRQDLRREFLERLGDQVLLLPTMQIPAPPVGAWQVEIEGAMVPLHRALSRFTLPFSLLGLPAVAVPTLALGEGLRASAQLVAAPGNEAALLAAAASVEATADACNS